ncbi:MULTISPECIES: GNAT family N-acetyltransferase [Paenibacillus]|uniref:GNAT family N-acetyltransferase n=1 Tax=Paenibacillus woosongensis TaxID=307580 RepID=A0A7X2Z3Y8_9BACL|nr:GNAT family N-acetyltransferase [Paenibacillus woosongensis]MUG46583.1 GNAT family N-acetyltransferase [Paenibacillus woosongensis]
MITLLSLRDPEIAEQIWSLQHAAYRLEAQAVGVKHLPPLPDTFESLRNSPDTFYGEVTPEGEVFGAIAVTFKKDEAVEITRLMVHPQHLRQGIGRSLLRHVIGKYPNTALFEVKAGKLNTPAVSLYEQQGFVAAGTLMAIPNVELTIYQLEPLKLSSL